MSDLAMDAKNQHSIPEVFPQTAAPKRCPKCSGRLYHEAPKGDWYCLTCGWRHVVMPDYGTWQEDDFDEELLVS
jgi:hypothetical protein